ncbi:glycosyltransferase [Bifidobacterium psychraerophilum]|uniref:Group 1 glycosyl transferase n=1 Tax=Bifidobacterium psychraerophilum TaxID=218140 RepID=A0A087CLW1_9BIFI|nr:glycosyltransferase [Bifidobacterium psychraerophilum]KFI84261.1 group 1 glycosyl transferase [Bifidobacterium psychraerophilum]PKA94118.1 glycosyltransferase involved in cell wall biosynthesis [Bifidobacterium psychraerophilum DSM 22366]
MTHILAFGTYNSRKHPRVGILIDGLRRNGCEVTEINRPLNISTAGRVEVLKHPWKLFGFARTLLSLWRQLSKDARIWVRENGRPDAVLIGYMGHFDVLLAHHIFHSTPLILDHLIFAGDTAKDRGADGVKVRLLNKLDRMAIDAATLVLVDTEEHQAMLQHDDQSLVVPVGATDEWFQAQHSNTGEQEGVIFFGLYTPLQGTTVIAEALVLLAKEGIRPRITMIGTGQDYPKVRSRLEQLDNVKFIEWVEPEELPGMVASHAISLGIFSTTPKGLRVVPNKVYQSMAAGCAVVTSDTPPQRRAVSDGVTLVPPGDARSLADTLKNLITDRSALLEAEQKSSGSAVRFTASEVSRPLASWLQQL